MMMTTMQSRQQSMRESESANKHAYKQRHIHCVPQQSQDAKYKSIFCLTTLLLAAYFTQQSI
jgi:hypothetical protein